MTQKHSITVTKNFTIDSGEAMFGYCIYLCELLYFSPFYFRKRNTINIVFLICVNMSVKTSVVFTRSSYLSDM